MNACSLDELRSVISDLEKLQHGLLGTRPPKDISDFLEKFGSGAAKCLKVPVSARGEDRPESGYMGIRSFALKAMGVGSKIDKNGRTMRVSASLKVGESLFTKLRENVLPNVNMSHLMFEGDVEFHRSRFYVARGESGESVLRAFKKQELGSSQLLLSTFAAAVPDLLLGWYETWRDLYPEDDSWNDEMSQRCLEELREVIVRNESSLERFALDSYSAQCGSTFPGAYAIGNLPCVTPLGSVGPQRPSRDVLWGFREDRRAEGYNNCRIRNLERMMPSVSRFSLWWSIYTLKCALNINQYSLYLVSPAPLGVDRAGVILVADLESEVDLTETLLALELIGDALLAGVDRTTLAWTERERRKARVQAAGAKERLLQQELALVSFGHDSRRPAETMIQVLNGDWTIRDRIAVASFLATSLWHRLASYQALIGKMESVPEARSGLLADKHDCTAFAPLSAIWQRELIAAVLRCLVGTSGWRRVREALWGKSGDTWDRVRHLFRPILDLPLPENALVQEPLIGALADTTQNLSNSRSITIAYEGPDLFIPIRCSGAGGRSVEPRLAIALPFILSEIATNTFKHQYVTLDPKRIEARLIVSREDTGNYALSCEFSPVSRRQRDPETCFLGREITVIGLTSLRSVLASIGCSATSRTIRHNGAPDGENLPYYGLRRNSDDVPVCTYWSISGLLPDAVKESRDG